jgi:hypothetical protein
MFFVLRLHLDVNSKDVGSNSRVVWADAVAAAVWSVRLVMLAVVAVLSTACLWLTNRWHGQSTSQLKKGL